MNPGTTWVGAAGHTQGGLIQVAVYPLGDFCQIEQEGFVDACLIGTWESQPFTLEMLQETGAGIVEEFYGGEGVRMTFTADATEILDFDSMSDLVAVVENGMVDLDDAEAFDYAFTTRLNGTSEMKISAAAGVLDYLAPLDSTLTITSNLLIGRENGPDQEVPVFDHVPLSELSGGGPAIGEASVSYVCGAKSLTMPLSARSDTVTWTRVH